MEKADTGSATRNNRTICLPFSQEVYNENIRNPADFRKCIDKHIASNPELFPSEITGGYRMKDGYYSKKQSIMIRRIEIAGTAYTIRPSFVTPYMAGMTDGVEKALFLRKFNVPFWALSQVFGKNPMYWHRLEQALGRNSIVGTTVRNADDIPEHLGADEKHTWILGDKVYIATTVGDECILGASISGDAGEQSLRNAYQVFKDEAQCLKPDYTPTTVNMDGWQATRNAWKFLFTSVVIICCFLHVFIKIRDRAKRKYKDIFTEAASKLWDCYHAENKRSFSQRVRRLVDQNFAPYNPRTVEKLHGFKSPSERLNKFRYHDNWLHNLYVSASLGGLSQASPKCVIIRFFSSLRISKPRALTTMWPSSLATTQQKFSERCLHCQLCFFCHFVRLVLCFQVFYFNVCQCHDKQSFSLEF